jgi:hypothetical protein
MRLGASPGNNRFCFGQFPAGATVWHRSCKHQSATTMEKLYNRCILPIADENCQGLGYRLAADRQQIPGCIRFNPHFGVCLTKSNAAIHQHKNSFTKLVLALFL